MLYIRIETDKMSIFGQLVQLLCDKDGYSVTVGNVTIDCRDIVSFETIDHRATWEKKFIEEEDTSGFKRYCSIGNAVDFS